MTLTQMQYFRAVCTYESYTKAAAALFVTQPAVSKAIRELEAECGTPLLIRKGNSLTVTQAGRLLLEEVNAVLSHVDSLNQMIASDALKRNFVRVGLSTFSSCEAFPGLCAEFHRRYPELRIFSREDSTEVLFQLLDADQTDVIFTAPSPRNREENPELLFWALNDFGLSYYVSRGHRWARRGSVSLEEIAAEPLIMLSDRYSSARRLEALFTRRGLAPNVLMRTSQMFTVERFVESGAAGGYLPSALGERNKNIVRLPCPDDPPPIRTCMIWKKKAAEHPAVADLIRLAKEMYPDGGQ